MSVLLVLPWFAIRPIEIPIGGGTIPFAPFDLLAVVGAAIGYGVARRFALANAFSRYETIDLGVHAVGFGLVAAPLLNAAFYDPAWFVEVWSEPRFPGLSSYGGFTGALVGLAVWRWRRRVEWLRPADAVAYAFPFAWMPCRMSCFFAHDHPGVESDFFLAVGDYYGLGAARHDLGLYEALWAMAVAVLFYWLSRKERRPGFYLVLVVFLYTTSRFALDFLRAGPDFPNGDVRYFGLTPGHYASVVFLALGVVLLRHVLPAQRR